MSNNYAFHNVIKITGGIVLDGFNAAIESISNPLHTVLPSNCIVRPLELYWDASIQEYRIIVYEWVVTKREWIVTGDDRGLFAASKKCIFKLSQYRAKVPNDVYNMGNIDTFPIEDESYVVMYLEPQAPLTLVSDDNIAKLIGFAVEKDAVWQ